MLAPVRTVRAGYRDPRRRRSEIETGLVDPIDLHERDPLVGVLLADFSPGHGLRDGGFRHEADRRPGFDGVKLRPSGADTHQPWPPSVTARIHRPSSAAEA